MVKVYIIDMWKKRKHKLYDGDSGSGLQLHTHSSCQERNGKFREKLGQNSKFIKNGKFGRNGKLHLGLNISSSTHNCGCKSMAVALWQQYEYYYYYCSYIKCD